jgi:hypothetical protein
MTLITNSDPPVPRTAGRRRRWCPPAILFAAMAVALGTAPLAPAKSIVDRDGVQLTSSGFDFGDDTFAEGAPTGDGTLTWVVENGSVTPKLTGTLHLKNVSTCARLRMHYLNGSTLLTSRHGGAVCAPDNDHHTWSVNLSPYSDIAITSVIVSIESQNTAGAWEAVDSDTYWRNLADDEVTITGDGFDFGGSGFANDAPTGPATLDWTIENGAVGATATGTVHIDRNAGACVRVRLAIYQGDGQGGRGPAIWSGIPTAPICAADNSYHSEDVVVSANPAFLFPRVEVVKVILESLAANGSWNQVGSQLVYLSEDF